MEDPPPPKGATGADLLDGVMRERNLSQGDVAAETGLSQSTVSRLLNGENISLAYAVLLHSKYGIPITAWPAQEPKPRRKGHKRGPSKKPAKRRKATTRAAA